jgi:hypothetical protein
MSWGLMLISTLIGFGLAFGAFGIGWLVGWTNGKERGRREAQESTAAIRNL